METPALNVVLDFLDYLAEGDIEDAYELVNPSWMGKTKFREGYKNITNLEIYDFRVEKNKNLDESVVWVEYYAKDPVNDYSKSGVIYRQNFYVENNNNNNKPRITKIKADLILSNQRKLNESHWCKNKTLNIEKKPFASGGEGAVHLFKDSGYEDYCVKIYFDNEKDVNKAKAKAKEREQKVTFMVNNQPENLKKDNCLLCWPIEVIYDYKTKEFLGFMMPKAFPKSEILYKICLTKNNRSLSKKWSTKYDRKEVSGLISRLKLCVNISSGLNAIHETNKYVLVDFKPQNILVTHTGKISVID